MMDWSRWMSLEFGLLSYISVLTSCGSGEIDLVSSLSESMGGGIFGDDDE